MCLTVAQDVLSLRSLEQQRHVQLMNSRQLLSLWACLMLFSSVLKNSYSAFLRLKYTLTCTCSCLPWNFFKNCHPSIHKSLHSLQNDHYLRYYRERTFAEPQAEWMVESLAEIDRCEDGEAQTKKLRCRWLSEQWMQGERNSFTTQEET